MQVSSPNRAAAVALAAALLGHAGCRSGAAPPAEPRAPAGAAEREPPLSRGFEIHGHRGTRALRPENTIESFLAAIELGADVLELDVLLTKDDVLVVHHDERLNPNTTREPSGAWLEETGPAIRALTFAELSTYDVGRLRPGSDYAASFPRQVGSDGVRIPKLEDVVGAAERASGGRIRYNMELKSTPGAAHSPPLPALVERTVDLVRERGLADRTLLQAFELQALGLVHDRAPEIRTACLTEAKTLARGEPGVSPWTAPLDIDEIGSVPRLVQLAGCKDWTPDHRTLTQQEILEAHQLGMRVIPWTVNDREEMQRLIGWGVDGLITDDPELLASELRRR
jgi:glycerophosphoryl diester phosphodiesterase